MDVPTAPQVGMLAWHKGGLDPREVVAVDASGPRTKVKLDILGRTTDWLWADNYEFEEAGD